MKLMLSTQQHDSNDIFVIIDILVGKGLLFDSRNPIQLNDVFDPAGHISVCHHKFTEPSDS